MPMPMRPSTDWRETVAPDETERFLAYAEFLRGLQQKAAKGRRDRRGLHTQARGGFEAEFTVLPDLPEAARVGIFAQPGEYRGWVRFSNGAGQRHADKRPDIRGLAIKLVGVPGRKLIPGLEDAKTMDFVMIQTPSTPVRNAAEFIALVEAAQKPALLVPRLGARVGWLRLLQMLPALAASVRGSTRPLWTVPYSSAAPMRWGDHAAQVRVVPQDRGNGAASDGSIGFLGTQLAERVRQAPVVFDFCVQFYVDAKRTPIEDTSVAWSDAASPPVPVARLRIPQQDAESVRGRDVAHYIETLSFDPWHAPVEFRPLGDVMRARNVAYRLSTEARKATLEPDDADAPAMDASETGAE
jgi:hypothetical protein